jgi:hypothetical protein
LRYLFFFAVVFLLTLLGFHFLVLCLSALKVDWLDLLFSTIGVLVFLVLFLKTKILQITYIFFHELAHALAVLVSSGKIHEFKVTSEFGYVKSDQTSFFIRLAPYFLPLFPLAIVALDYPTMILMKYHQLIVPWWFRALFVGLFSLSFCTQWFYNFKLLRLETTDVSPAEVMVSIVSILCGFFYSSAILFFLVFNQTSVLKAVYFL